MRLTISLFCILFISCTSPDSDSTKILQPETIRIMFGSCANETRPQPMLRIAAGKQPDVFVFLGDNIYGDTRDMSVLRQKYDQLGSKPEFQALRDSSIVLAIWDDHDFGENDAGRHYPYKAQSKEIFLDFWNVPIDSDRRRHDGIYGVEYYEKAGVKVQFILLDTRTFRDDLRPRTEMDTAFKNDYVPYETTDSTMLGDQQWAWLENTLQKPADLRIVATSNQFSHTYNGWESWTNIPHERQRLLNMIRDHNAEHVLFISGDVHWGEISAERDTDCYPLYDITSSGITETWPNIEPNANRVGHVVRQNNVGIIELDLSETDTTLMFGLIDSTGMVVQQHNTTLRDLRFSTSR